VSPLKDDKPRVSTPVVKRQRIGEKFVGAIVRVEQRDRMKKINDEWKPILKDNGKARQELVVHCVAMPGTTTVAGIGDDIGIPAPGTEVRLILNGKAFSQWIEARKMHRGGELGVGDVVIQTVDVAQAYDAGGNPKGAELTDQAVIDTIPRGTSVGFYGPLELHEPTDHEWVAVAEKAHGDATRLMAADPVFTDDEAPF
jgi:hypothetical protein